MIQSECRGQGRRTVLWTDVLVWADGRTDMWMDRVMDGRTDGRTDRATFDSAIMALGLWPKTLNEYCLDQV